MGEGMDAVKRRIKMTVAYDGTAYSGWQLQRDVTSVQGVLEEALGKLVGCEVRVNGSGRTDRGVHARGQVAHADVTTQMSEKSLLMGMNATLPPDVRVLSLVKARPNFDARRSAHGKEYRYFVWNDRLILPDRRLYAAHIYGELDLERMREGAKRFVGTHDFAAFCANPHRKLNSTVRIVTAVSITKRGKEFTFSVKGGGFLYKQVRSIVGFLLRIGAGEEPPEAVTELLEAAQPRTARVPSAPARGLFLWKVWYRSVVPKGVADEA